MESLSENKNDNLNNNNNNNNDNYLYEMIFNIVTNISMDSENNEQRIKILKIIFKIIENITQVEIKQEDSEKFRRLKTSNPNIELIFKINGVYNFLIFLGFQEEMTTEDLTLFLPKNNINIETFQKILPYINLLLLNFQENEKDQINYFEKKRKISLPKSFITENDSDDEQDEPIIFTKNKQSNNAIDILKETGKERYKKALDYTNEINNTSIFSSFWNWITCGQSNTKNEEKKENEKIKKNFMTLQDLEYKNPINDMKCDDNIGKKCLELTNEFRRKNGLSILEWDDNIWRIAYIHSKNMGEGKVPFGHKGFNERINSFPFSFSRACENVYMCQGLSQYNLAENAVNGWINSPGHRKNLLSYTSHCAIAVYRNNYGSFYLTQLFALKGY